MRAAAFILKERIMLKTKDVTLSSGAVVTVKEITVKQALLLFTETETGLELKGHNLLFLATGLVASDLPKLTETDICNLWDACKEIHAFFFRLAKELNLPALLQAAIPALITASSSKSTDKLLNLLAPAAGLLPKSTAGGTGILSRLAAGFKK